MSDLSPIQVVARRLEEANLSTKRFIQCKPGEKASIDHSLKSADEVSGNYGIYATAEDALVIIDVDDYGEIDDKSGLSALGRLPPTFEQGSPHNGTHRVYRADTEIIAEIFEEELGKKNPKPTYGEVRVANQYVVGAGSQLDGCSKDWCDECAKEDGGFYTVQEDREIATVSKETLLEVLRADPNYAEEEDEEQEELPADDRPSIDASEDDILDYALNESKDEKLQRLWRGDYSDYSDDRSEAECALAAKLGWWLQGDKRAVARAMDDANTQKWSERDDDSYRESVLEAVDGLDDYYTPKKPAPSPEPEDSEVEDTETGEVRQLPQPHEFTISSGCYGQYHEKYDDEGNVYYDWNQWTNFQLEVNSFLRSPQGDVEIDLTVWPAQGDSYEVTAGPRVFNEVRDFKAAICSGLTTTFEGGQDELNHIKRFVGTQAAPNRVGTHHMGLHGGEWVTPKGVLTADGWTDDPETVYIDREIGVERKWSLSPEDGSDFDPEIVADILELLPKTRDKERFIPAMMWFYAAPLRPLIHDWTGQFNILGVLGDTGTGKTTSISTLWECLGMEGEPLTADDTKFTLVTTLGSTNSIPMWFDEYKPSDMADYEVDRFWNEVRKTTRGGVSQRGNADKTTTEYHLQAPVVVSGEERVTGAAEERRGIFTTFRKEATESGSQTAEAFAKLSGGSVKNGEEIDYYDGYDLSHHARAYYNYILGMNDDDLEEAWRAAADHVNKLLAEYDIEGLEDLVEQGLQTIRFGATLYRHFCQTMDADTDAITSDDVDDAILYVATRSIGGINRKSHVDSFFELAARASHHDYLTEGDHYSFVYEGREDEELRMNIATSYDKIAKYAREHDASEDLLNSKHDYDQRITDAVDDEGSYIVRRSQNTPPLGRCVGLNFKMAQDALDDFEKSMFAEDNSTAQQDTVTPLGSLEPGYTDVTAEVIVRETTDDDSRAPPLKGVIVDNSGMVDFLSWDNVFDEEIQEDSCYLFENAKVGFNQDGAHQIELVQGATNIKQVEKGVGNLSQSQPEDLQQNQLDASTDGGEDVEGVVAKVHQWFQSERPDGAVKLATVAGAINEAPDKVNDALDLLSQKGRINSTGNGYTL